jgi:CBS domain-containing protein
VKQITTKAPAQNSPLYPRPAAAHRHRHHAATADHGRAVQPRGCGRVPDEARRHDGPHGHGHGRANRPAGIITQADIARAIANGKDLNDVRVHAVTITRPAVTTTASIRDAATIMTARHLRHLPVAGAVGLLGVIDITDVCLDQPLHVGWSSACPAAPRR